MSMNFKSNLSNTHNDNDIISIIKKLPKSELHCHIEGTLEPELMFKLAKKNNIKLSYNSINELRNSYKFNNLQSFLDIYYKGICVLKTEDDFYELTISYLKRISKDNVKHTEIFFDPQSHIENGISFSTIINGIIRALHEGNKIFNISSFLIMCFLRHLSLDNALQTLELALPYKKYIKAVGLDSSEKDNPPEKFKKVFDKARNEGFLTVAHAGEEGPSDYIWTCINDLCVSRIDHGNACINDNLLLNYLIENQIPLTLCPLSNIKLKVIDSLENHIIKLLLEKGVCVTINSDDPAYFDGYIEKNIILIQETFNLSLQQIIQIIKNGFIGSFLTKERKNIYLQQIDNIIQSL